MIEEKHLTQKHSSLNLFFLKSEKELLSIQHKRQSDILCLSILDRYWTLKCFKEHFWKVSRISNVVTAFSLNIFVFCLTKIRKNLILKNSFNMHHKKNFSTSF